ncbi:MAG: ABC transporter permease subunit [Firmicutes bacterium]|nr:ABC transporter permease subunit [Bacillota bacterium]
MLTSTTRNRLLTLASILVLLLVWKLLAVFWHQEIIMPSPELTLIKLWMVINSVNFWPAVGATLARGLIGFAISCVLGVILGFAAGFSAPVFWLFQPWVTVIRTTPVMSVVILAIIWFRSDIVPIFVTFLMIFPIIYGNVVAGIKNVDRQLLEMAYMYRVKSRRIIFELYFPSILPYLLAGASNAMGITWKVIIAAEILSQPVYAIGTNLMIAKIYLETGQVLAWTVVAILISFVFEYLINALENRLKTWG